jgi:glycerol kinase
VSEAADVVVAIDQGSHATRAVAFTTAGHRLAATTAAVDTLRPAADRAEHDGEGLVAGVRVALDDLAVQVPATRWRAAGIATQRSTIACWDRETGTLLAPVISWQDRRQAGWIGRMDDVAARVHLLTGLPLSPHYGASKLRWCLDHVDEVRVALRDGRLCAGPLASLLLARLLEERPFATDEANASRTQLWSPGARDWSAELLDLFGVPRRVLPRLLPTRAAFGTLRVRGTRVPLLICTGDQAAVPFATGPLDAAAVYVNLGTGAFALRPVSGALLAPPLLTSVLASDDASVRYVLEGTVNGAGSAIEWFERRERMAAAPLLAALDAAPPATADAAYFLNGISGLGSPWWAPEFESRFEGDSSPTDRLRAVVESMAFLLRANLDQMAARAGRPARIVASGGLTRSRYLLRTLSSLAGLPVDRLDDAEATARGLAFLVAGQPGDWRGPARERLEPAPDPVLEQRYAQWTALLESALGG